PVMRVAVGIPAALRSPSTGAGVTPPRPRTGSSPRHGWPTRSRTGPRSRRPPTNPPRGPRPSAAVRRCPPGSPGRCPRRPRPWTTGCRARSSCMPSGRPRTPGPPPARSRAPGGCAARRPAPAARSPRPTERERTRHRPSCAVPAPPSAASCTGCARWRWAFVRRARCVRRRESGRRRGRPRYRLHTFRRLMPPAAVTSRLVLAGPAALPPSSMWQTIMQEAVASALYLQNLLLVLLQVDYHARDAGGSSPLQHFWSLSVQGQAFVVWPLLFLLVARRARAGRSVRRPLIALVSVIGAASLTWSILSPQSQQQIAYFDTAARMWEFAAGSLLALALPALDRLTGARRPEDWAPPRLRVLRALTGWAGIVGLLACGILMDVSLLFPGWIALWPLAAASAVVVAGHSGTRWGVD